MENQNVVSSSTLSKSGLEFMAGLVKLHEVIEQKIAELEKGDALITPEFVTDQIEQRMNAALNEKVESMVDDAIDGINLDRKVEEAVDDANIDRMVEDAISDHNFSSEIRDAISDENLVCVDDAEKMIEEKTRLLMTEDKVRCIVDEVVIQKIQLLFEKNERILVARVASAMMDGLRELLSTN